MGNSLASVTIRQTPGAGAPINLISGLTAIQGPGDGIRIEGGSHVKVRNSALWQTGGSAVAISTATGNPSGTDADNNDLSFINLGSVGDPGGNTFQGSPLTTGNSGQAGICLSVAPGSGTLMALGNVFGQANCADSATPGPELELNSTGCDNSCDAGACDLGFASAARAVGNGFNVSACAQ